jgi:hypothetical protein
LASVLVVVVTPAPASVAISVLSTRWNAMLPSGLRAVLAIVTDPSALVVVAVATA